MGFQPRSGGSAGTQAANATRAVRTDTQDKNLRSAVRHVERADFLLSRACEGRSGVAHKAWKPRQIHRTTLPGP